MNLKLTIELVPSTSWCTNLRSLLPKSKWDELRKQCYRDANYCCEICSGKGTKHPVECHEVWEYDDENHIQKLKRLIALCPKCHTVKHIGKASVAGKFDSAVLQFMRVNQCDHDMAMSYIRKRFVKYGERSRHQWELDLGELEEFRK